MKETKDTQQLNTRKTADSQNKMCSNFTIPGEYGYEWNLITDSISWMGKFYEKLGYKKSNFPKTLRDWEDKIIHPFDSQKVKNARHQHLKTGDIFCTQYRVKQENGKYISLSAQGKATVNSQGTPYKWKGSVQLNPNKLG